MEEVYENLLKTMLAAKKMAGGGSWDKTGIYQKGGLGIVLCDFISYVYSWGLLSVSTLKQ